MYLCILEQNKLQWIKDLRVKKLKFKNTKRKCKWLFLYTWNKKASQSKYTEGRTNIDLEEYVRQLT